MIKFYLTKLYQLFYQIIFLFKYFSKFITILFLFFVNCDNHNKNNFKVAEIERFEKSFFEYDLDSINNLISDYPFLFPTQFSIQDWINIREDKLRNEIFSETIEIYQDQYLEQNLSKLYHNLNNFFLDFRYPRSITLNNGVDYDYRVVYSDDILLISLDCFLGESRFYSGIPTYQKSKMNKNYLFRDIAEKIVFNFVKYPKERQFVNRAIYYGKIMYFMENALDFEISKVFKYDNEQINWLNKNEKLIWTKLIENDMLFSTSNVYYENLILENPYSKFGTQLDYQIPPMVGKWIGYKIVESYIKTNNKNIVDVLEMDEYELYLDSNFNP
tara:strand:+ start:8466 stop:9452 length:987 start_codon:yes stop_codon:yes gene_type:complete